MNFSSPHLSTLSLPNLLWIVRILSSSQQPQPAQPKLIAHIKQQSWRTWRNVNRRVVVGTRDESALLKKKCTHITIWTRDKAAKKNQRVWWIDSGSSCTGNFWSTNMRDRAKIGCECSSSKRNSSSEDGGTQIHRKILIRGFGRSNISSIRLIFLIFASVLNFQHSGCDESTNDFQKISKLSLLAELLSVRGKKRLLTTALLFLFFGVMTRILK